MTKSSEIEDLVGVRAGFHASPPYSLCIDFGGKKDDSC